MKNKYDCVVLTYNVPHRKTYDTLSLLKAKGYREILVYATKMTYTKKFKPIYEHRPKDIYEIPIEQLCINLDFEYHFCENGYKDLVIDEDVPILVCGAGILPNEIVAKYKVINAHPGYIPEERGLDALKWAIVENKKIGVTTHLIGDEVDAGEIIERKEIDLYAGDTFHSLAYRVYENEIKMLVDAICKVNDEHIIIKAGNSEVHKRMPKEIELNIMKNFNNLINSVYHSSHENK